MTTMNIELQRKLEIELARGMKTEPGADLTRSPLHKAVAALGLSSHTGTVAFVGTTATDYHVQFNTANVGYSSSWPRWAFDMARCSLETGKKLFVVSNGDPYGYNLTTVLVLA